MYEKLILGYLFVIVTALLALCVLYVKVFSW